MNVRFPAVIVLLTLLLASGLLLRLHYGTAERNQLPPASHEEETLLQDLVRKEQRLLFDSIVSGNPSAYATIYYNDPAVTLHTDYLMALRQDGDQARQIAHSLSGGPKGGDTGYLTARIASLLYGERNRSAWDRARDEARREGRQPRLADLPADYVPMERVTADQWSEPDYHMFDARVSGDHATAKVAFGPPEAGGQVFSYEFIRVDGRWYVSYMESSWSQGSPDYKD